MATFGQSEDLRGFKDFNWLKFSAMRHFPKLMIENILLDRLVWELQLTVSCIFLE